MKPEHYPEDYRGRVAEKLDDIVARRREELDVYGDYPENDIDSLETFQKLPLLEDEKALTPMGGVNVFLPGRKDGSVKTQATSGTTSGVSTVVFWSQADLERVHAMFEGAMDRREHDVDTAFILAREQLVRSPEEVFGNAGATATVGSPRDMSFNADLFAATEPDTIWGTPTTIRKLGEKLEERDVDRETVELIFSHGEPLTPSLRREITRLFPAADLPQLFGASEASSLGYQCPEMEGGSLFHLLTEEHFVEVVDPETGQPLPPGEAGEMVITCLNEDTSIPTIRYRTGDRASMEEAPCDCTDMPALRLYGRLKFDAIKIGGIAVYRDRFEKALETASDLVKPQYQIVLDDSDKHPSGSSVEIRIVPRKDFNDPAAAERQAAEKIMRNFQVSPQYTWKQAVRKGVLPPISIDFVEETAEGMKNRPVIDDRGD